MDLTSCPLCPDLLSVYATARWNVTGRDIDQRVLHYPGPGDIWKALRTKGRANWQQTPFPDGSCQHGLNSFNTKTPSSGQASLVHLLAWSLELEDVACWLAYNEARRRSKNPELFGTGIPEGVLAPEAANNAVTGSAMIPTLALGIPGSSVTAILLSGLIFHGIRTGPRFITEYGGLTYTIILSMFVANIFMLFLGVLSAKAGMKIAKIKCKNPRPLYHRAQRDWFLLPGGATACLM